MAQAPKEDQNAKGQKNEYPNVMSDIIDHVMTNLIPVKGQSMLSNNTDLCHNSKRI